MVSGKHIAIVAMGALSYGMLSSFAKIAYGQGYSAAEITFSQAGIGAVILWVCTLVRKKSNKTAPVKVYLKLLLAGTSMGLSAYTYYLSVSYIPASLAIVLLMQITWMSLLAEWLVYGKKPVFVELITSVAIISGTALAGNLVSSEGFNISFTGVILVILAAFFYTLFILFTSRMETTDIPMFEKSALITTGSAMIIFIINAPSLTIDAHYNFGLLQWGAFLALFGTVIPPVCFSFGMPKIGVGLSAVLLTLELPAAVFCAHIILGEQITLLQIAGIVIMLGAIIYLNLVKTAKAATSTIH